MIPDPEVYHALLGLVMRYPVGTWVQWQAMGLAPCSCYRCRGEGHHRVEGWSKIRAQPPVVAAESDVVLTSDWSLAVLATSSESVWPASDADSLWPPELPAPPVL